MVCGQCIKQFEIIEQDRAFYRRIKVPEPTFCPDCRRQRRFAFRNERALYSRACDLCKKITVNFYSPSYAGPVYCQPCWWSDNWDPFLYARKYDPSAPFFDQLKDLFRSVPQIAMMSKSGENSDFTAHCWENRNGYLLISSGGNEDCYYGLQIAESQNVVDSMFARGSELGYELVDCEKMYNSSWCQQSSNCMDSSFLYDCSGCTNCFMSANLKNKNYVFNNEQLNRGEYEKRMSAIYFGSYTKIEGLKQDFISMIHTVAIHKYSQQTRCENSTGNYLLNCVNANECFDARNLEDCKYIVISPGPTKDSYDSNYIALGSELFCDVLSNIEPAMNEQFCQYSWASSNLQYCSYVMNSDNCFGSQGLRKARFCILNTQYSQEEYEKLRARIIEDMSRRGEYGQFFPANLSAFGYNETIANDDFPLSKEEALGQGFNWCDETAGKFGKPTKEWSSVPDDIAHIDESIMREVLACSDCGKNFKIVKAELSFYKKMNVPLPRRCFDCRHMARMRMRNPRHLWHRQCMCDRAGHDHGSRAEVAPELQQRRTKAGSQCPTMFETTYAPDRSEKVFCEACYQKEIV
ncbi:hypothetical protein HY623_02905 [Candidatus Uhrbacteria bacterium]|nr:hypothetical protein [Candidatus Uhrbacteria bacterium]